MATARPSNMFIETKSGERASKQQRAVRIAIAPIGVGMIWLPDLVLMVSVPFARIKDATNSMRVLAMIAARPTALHPKAIFCTCAQLQFVDVDTHLVENRCDDAECPNDDTSGYRESGNTPIHQQTHPAAPSS